jgi:hypothetical protein
LDKLLVIPTYDQADAILRGIQLEEEEPAESPIQDKDDKPKRSRRQRPNPEDTPEDRCPHQRGFGVGFNQDEEPCLSCHDDHYFDCEEAHKKR